MTQIKQIIEFFKAKPLLAFLVAAVMTGSIASYAGYASTQQMRNANDTLASETENIENSNESEEQDMKEPINDEEDPELCKDGRQPTTEGECPTTEDQEEEPRDTALSSSRSSSSSSEVRGVPQPINDQPDVVTSIFGEDMLDNYIATHLCSNSTSDVRIAYTPDSTMNWGFDGIEDIPGVSRVSAYYFDLADMNSYSTTIGCYRKTGTVQTSTDFLNQYLNISYSFEDPTIYPESPTNLQQWVSPQSISKVSQPQYIIANQFLHDERIVAFEYGDYIIHYEYMMLEEGGPHSQVDNGELLFYLK
jgi:hypothetical protein